MSTTTTRTTTRALTILLALPLTVALSGSALAASGSAPAAEQNPFAPFANQVTGQGGGNGKVQVAGRVGKADDKNPRGQSLSDHNNGYECDGNRGIGPMNPAHTGCLGVNTSTIVLTVD